MIFIDKEQRTIMIPKHINCSGPMKLTLKHKLTNAEFEFNNLTSSLSANGTTLTNDDSTLLFWTFNDLDFSALPTGEYDYNLNGLETGLLQVTQQVTQPISYNTEKTIIQYGN